MLKKTKQLEDDIQNLFTELEESMQRYQETQSFDDWTDCVGLLPKIADLVTCLKLEVMKLEGRFPVN